MNEEQKQKAEVAIEVLEGLISKIRSGELEPISMETRWSVWIEDDPGSAFQRKRPGPHRTDALEFRNATWRPSDGHEEWP
jgi:hypothetical protein